MKLRRLSTADAGFDTELERLAGEFAVTNAAFSDRAPFYEADLDGFHRTVQVTMWGAFYTMRASARPRSA